MSAGSSLLAALAPGELHEVATLSFRQREEAGGFPLGHGLGDAGGLRNRFEQERDAHPLRLFQVIDPERWQEPADVLDDPPENTGDVPRSTQPIEVQLVGIASQLVQEILAWLRGGALFVGVASHSYPPRAGCKRTLTSV